jgi:hypothetical protein
MLQIVTKRYTEDIVEYQRRFTRREDRSRMLSFDCSPEGVVDVDALYPEGRANYLACINGELNVDDEGVITFHRTIRHPAVGKCECGREVVLDGDTRGEGIDCECGRIYNAVGQELRARCWWEHPDGDGDGFYDN